MVNYLEVGKTWQALQEDVEDERVEEDWIELKDETNQIVCLLCPAQFTSFHETLQHMIISHSFDFRAVTSAHDFYQKVKIVNFIRRNLYRNLCFYCESKHIDRQTLGRHIEEHQSINSEFPDRQLWDQSEFLFPTYENDQFLMFLDDDQETIDTEVVMETEVNDGRSPTIIPEDLSEISVPPKVQLPADFDLDAF